MGFGVAIRERWHEAWNEVTRSPKLEQTKVPFGWIVWPQRAQTRSVVRRIGWPIKHSPARGCRQRKLQRSQGAGSPRPLRRARGRSGSGRPPGTRDNPRGSGSRRAHTKGSGSGLASGGPLRVQWPLADPLGPERLRVLRGRLLAGRLLVARVGRIVHAEPAAAARGIECFAAVDRRLADELARLVGGQPGAAHCFGEALVKLVRVVGEAANLRVVRAGAAELARHRV